MANLLIEVNELFKNISNPDYIIIDCRFDLSNENWGYSDYLKGHIPGAQYADLNKNLSSPITLSTGRHPLPNSEKFIAFLSELGIDKNKTVVVYDASYGSYAARLWWLLRAYGHSSIVLLNGGFQAWTAAGFSIESGIALKNSSKFVGDFSVEYMIDQESIEKNINDEKFLLIDARSPQRFAGIEEPIDSVAGHIPGAINIFHQTHLDQNGFLLPNNKLEEIYSFIGKNVIEEHVVLYCGSGVTSCFNLFAMAHIGYEKPKLYAGSWSEWIRNSEHPVVKKDQGE
ncbi:MAG: sulfurtransferase [Chloroflexi bacterium HGW-Chloroflexi-8]|nr:MAG: sulfurtransferase [Chloroflexi bacterium HGW-Chloroflexi-8]